MSNKQTMTTPEGDTAGLVEPSHAVILGAPKPKKKSPVAPVKEATFGTAGLELAFVKAFASACRTGIPARILTSEVAIEVADGEASLIHGRAETARSTLLSQIRTHEIRRDNATSVIRDLPPEAEVLRETWLEQQKAAVSKIARLKDELTALEAGGDKELPAQFETYADLIERAMANIVAHRGKQMSRAKQRALTTVLADFEIVPTEHDMFRLTTSVLLAPPDGGLAMLGPFGFELSSGAISGASSRQRVKRHSWHPSRDELRDRLERYDSLSDRAILKLINAPFPELALTVLHRIDPALNQFPTWVDDDWRTKPFGEWLRKVYTSNDISAPFASRVRGQYASHSALRQLVAFYASNRFEQSEARLGADAKLKDILRDSEFSSAEFKAFLDLPVRATAVSQVLRDSRSAKFVWHTPVDNNGRGPSVRRYFSVLCRVCRRPATLAIRTPDLPRDLMCGSCMAMPGPLNTMSASVRFPAAYRDLGRSLESCLGEVRASTRHLVPLSPIENQVLSLTSLQANGLTSRELVAALGLEDEEHKVRGALRALEAKHLLVRAPGSTPLAYRPASTAGDDPRNSG